MAGKKKTTETETTIYPAGWEERVGAFAEAIEMSLEDVTAKLKGIVGNPTEKALQILGDEKSCPFEDFKSVFADVPTALLRASVSDLRNKKEVAAPATTNMERGASLDVLPSVPDDDSFLSMLKVGGELKVGSLEVVSAIKSALAERAELNKLPAKLKDRMEKFSEENEEPCGEAFYKLRKMITQRNYAEVLSVLGIEGHFVSEKRKKDFLNRLESNLWDAVYSFHKQLSGWQKSWMEGSTNPGMMIAAIASAAGGGQMPPGMMAPPETSFLRDSAEGVIDQINKIFAGTGIPVARALAYDAQNIKKILEDERLPSLIGATSKDQMLKMLGTKVSADYVRLERNLVRYILSIMELPKVDSGQSELVYLGAMIQLGLSIPWDKLFDHGDMNRTGFSRFNEDE